MTDVLKLENIPAPRDSLLAPSVRSPDSAGIASCAPSGRSRRALICLRPRPHHLFNSWTSHRHGQNRRPSTQKRLWPRQPCTSSSSFTSLQDASENIALLTIGASFLPLSQRNPMWVCLHSASQKCWVRNRDLLFCLGFGGLPVFTPSERVEALRLRSALRATSPLYSQGTPQHV